MYPLHSYGFILARDKVVHYARPWNHPLRPTGTYQPIPKSNVEVLTWLTNNKKDLELVINFIKSSPSLTNNESWVPLCLPEFNDRGYLYAYICYLIEDVCLVLLSTNQSKEKFFEFSNAKNTIYKVSLPIPFTLVLTIFTRRLYIHRSLSKPFTDR